MTRTRSLNSMLMATALFAAPFAAIAPTGSLEARAVPVAALLGAVAVALVAYVVSAVALVGRTASRPRPALIEPALGGC